MNEHLHALQLRLSNERVRLSQAKTEQERGLRTVWIRQIEKEIAEEHKISAEVENMSDDDLLRELGL